MSKLRVQGYSSLVRDTRSNAIVNTNTSEYTLYMERRKIRSNQGNEIRSAVREINTLKAELREIKKLIKEIINK
tara:strand:- start:1102 stop:1323 length:222 start_codon:yes stop_codon:yes gene_type:complete